MNDEERSRIERAKRLRDQVKKIVGSEPDKADEKKGKSEKPRDFIHRRMTELDKGDHAK